MCIRKNNQGFSLVELIVVIAIMVVLVSILFPAFMKYVEESRRATDIQNASSIEEGVLVDVHDDKITNTENPVKVVANNPTSIKTDVKSKGDGVEKGADFYYKYTSQTNKVEVYIGDSDKDLTDPDIIKDYKDPSKVKSGDWNKE